MVEPLYILVPYIPSLLKNELNEGYTGVKLYYICECCEEVFDVVEAEGKGWARYRPCALIVPGTGPG